jgi:hypothetical protein
MIVYEIRNKINGKSYIGQHSSKELGSYWGSGKLIRFAIEKYGIENFERIILERCNTKDELNESEKYWIKEKNTIANGYNLTEGGTGGDTSKFIDYSEDWREKQRINTTRYWESLSEEERKIRSEILIGSNNGMYNKVGFWKGKKLPAEIIQKQLGSRRSYKGENNPNWKGGSKKNCKCGKEIGLISETCSDCKDRTGEKNAFYGKSHSEEFKSKLSKMRTGTYNGDQNKPIIIDEVEYRSAGEASRLLNIPMITIRWRVLSKNKKFEKYKYK